MKNFVKNQRGVTMLSLVTAVTIILIIAGIVFYNAVGDIKIAKVQSLQSDIENLREKVTEYYIQNGKLPINSEMKYTNLSEIKNAGVISESVDTGDFYIIDLSSLDNLTLNYGQDYEKIRTGEVTTPEEANKLRDIFIINETSQNIFYVDGVELDDDIYYTNYTSDDVDKQAVNLRYYDNVEIPEGFYYVAGTKQTGVIISDVQNDDIDNSKKGNQFVWIPVENEKDYNQTETNAVKTGYLPDGFVQNDNEETNKEAEKQAVMNAHGFYVSRYEAGSDVNSAVSKKDVKSWGTTINLETAKSNAKKFINNDSVKSGLCSKTQLNLLANVKNIQNYDVSSDNYRIALYVIPKERWTPKYDRTSTYTDKNGKTATIPKGFSVSMKPNESTIENGLVVKAPDDSEFVWVPVPSVIYGGTAEIGQNYTPMAELQEESGTNYQGLLYEFNGTSSSYKNDWKVGTVNSREPSLITGNANDKSATPTSIAGTNFDASPGYYQTILGYTTSAGFGNDLQNQYNSMIESVKKYEGFYVARYELGLNKSNKAVSINANKDTSVNTANIGSNNSWYNLYKLCKNYQQDGITSTMIWGSQYDAILNWVAKQNQNVGDSLNGTKTNTSLVSGKYITDNLNNIYDLYGGHRELTVEGINADSRIARGGAYTEQKSPANRLNVQPSQVDTNNDTRMTLFIKD